MLDFIKDHTLIILSCLFSIGLFSLLIFLHIKESKFLTIDSKWLFISCLPILIALIVGGYIHKFKGFGIELETSLKNPIGQVNLIATDVLESISGTEKGSTSSIEALSDSERLKYQRLSFVIGKRNYYGENAIERYIELLPMLKFIEIKKSDGKFFGLMPAELLKENGRPNYQKINNFIKGIEEKDLSERFGDNIILEAVLIDTSILKLLPKARSSKFQFLPVTTKNGYLAGIITAKAIETRIADEVINAQTRK